MELWIEGTIDQVVETVERGLATTIATNPTIIANWTRDGRTLEAVIRELCSRTSAPVFVQLHGPDVESYLAEMRALQRISAQISPKLVATHAGIEAARVLAQQGEVEPLITAVATVNQAFLAAAAGAAYIAPYYGRIEDAGVDAGQLIRDIAALYYRHGMETGIAAASIRTPAQSAAALIAGADAVVMNYTVLEKLLASELTQDWINRFEQDWTTFRYEFDSE